MAPQDAEARIELRRKHAVTETSPLLVELRRLINSSGPMPVWRYMELCLTHPDYGYYVSRDPLGREGDFTTAPEVSQMFGELIGLWAASVWRLMGEPENVRLVELGPGRGTLMVDALRAAQVIPAFRAAVVVHLVEISPALQRRQRETLGELAVPTLWHSSFDEVPPGPAIVLANEFYDALPVHQAVKNINGWYERTIEIDRDGNFAFGIANEPIPLFEQLLPHAWPNARHHCQHQLRDERIGSFGWEQALAHGRSQ